MSGVQAGPNEHFEWGRYAILGRRAKRLLDGEVGQQRIAAFALRKNRVVAIGINSYIKTHPRQHLLARLAGQHRREYLHAEISALIRAPRDADTLVVVRIDKQGNFACAAPCPVCRAGINLFNPNLKVVHT